MRNATLLRTAALLAGCSMFLTAQAQAPAAATTASAPQGAAVQANGNVYAAGGQVHPSARIGGDYIVAAGRIVLDQPVDGDATLAGGSVEVRAPVGDDLRVTGGEVRIAAPVTGELLAAGGTVTLASTGSVGKSARIHAGTVHLDGRIDGGLRGSAENVIINGEIKGDVDVATAHLELGPNARIGGALKYTSDSELTRAAGAEVAGAITRAQGGPELPVRKSFHWEGRTRHPWIGMLFSFVGLLSAGLLFLLIAPAFGARAADRVRSSSLPALGLGFVAVVVTPVAAVMLFITILGIPLGIAVLALYPLALLIGIVVGTLFVARLIPGALKRPPASGWAPAVGYFALALLAVLIVARLPFVGGLLLGLLMFAGLGAAIMEIHGRRSAPPPAGGPAPVLPAAS